MLVLNVRNVHEALPEGIRLLYSEGIHRESRFGDVIVCPTPVTTVYSHPEECVLFWPQRDANPFFHFFEAIWMLLGRNDVDSIAVYAKRIAQFSDDGKTFHGAYGDRWRRHFMNRRRISPIEISKTPCDQLKEIRDLLAKNPKERRAVLQMWDAQVDLGRDGKDLPCNTQAYFWIEENEEGSRYLNMTVCNRSNDIIWGAYGANAVHFSFLLQYMAAWIGVHVGKYWQMSNNYHGYLTTLEPLKNLQDETASPPYTLRVSHQPYEDITPFKLVHHNAEVWMKEAELFWQTGSQALGYTEPFFRKVAIPMAKAFEIYKLQGPPDKYLQAIEVLEQCQALDWKLACQQWLQRRYEKWRTKQNEQINTSPD